MSEESSVIFIADANFFIQGGAQVETPRTIYMTEAALQEVRDARAKQILANFQLSHEIVTKQPSQESIETVTQAATDSGNAVLLSGTDIGLIALALDFMPKDVEPAPKKDPTPQPGFDEWITADSYGKIDEEEDVILCTTDATMQCVCQLLGITVVSSNGTRVAEVKRWLMRCSACNAETFDASKEFCPECGHHTLVRYALVMRDGVERELPLPRRFEPTARGKRFSIPKHVGGRHGKKDIITSEDMLMEERRKFRWSGGARKQQTAGDGVFFEARPMPRQEPQYGYGKVNPNQPHHLLGKKKKRNQN